MRVVSGGRADPVPVRWLGTFLEDPLDVPAVVLEFMAEQLEIEDPSGHRGR